MRMLLTVGVCVLALTSGALAQPKTTPAYLIAEFDVLDAASLKKFGEASNAVVKAHGGQFLSRRSKITSVIGEPPKNVTVIMFESLAKAQAYYQSAEYKAIVPLRDAGAKYRTYIVEGGDLAQ